MPQKVWSWGFSLSCGGSVVFVSVRTTSIRETVCRTSQEIFFSFSELLKLFRNSLKVQSAAYESTHVYTKCYSTSFSNSLEVFVSKILAELNIKFTWIADAVRICCDSRRGVVLFDIGPHSANTQGQYLNLISSIFRSLPKHNRMGRRARVLTIK